MSDYIDKCDETYLGLNTILYTLLYTDGDNWYINMLDGGVSESDVSPINDCTDYRTLLNLFKLSIVEDINGNPAIQTVQITEGAPCVSSCEQISLQALLYQCFYQDSDGNIYLGIKQGFDSEVQTILENYTGTYTNDQKNALNTFVVGVKTLFGITALNQKFDTMYWLSSANTNDEGINIANIGSNTITRVNNPTHTPFRGTVGDGATSYLETNFTPSTHGVNYQLNDAAAISYIRSNIAETAFDIYTAGGGHESVLETRNLADLLRANCNSGAGIRPSIANADSRGLVASMRCNATQIVRAKNNTLYSTAGNAVSGLPTGSLRILASTGTFSTKQQAFHCTSSCMSQVEFEAFFVLVEAFMDAIGAGVI